MAVRARWDKYEAAVLLDAYVKTVDEIITRSAAIEKVSMMLRKRALLAGETIDSSYRNTSGISYQFGVMQYAMTYGKKGIPQRSVLFQEIVDLYRTNPAEFASILDAAIQMSNDITTEEGKVGQESFEQTTINRNPHSVQLESSGDILIEAIRQNGIKYADKRDKGGCPWIIGGEELSSFVGDVRKLGVRFSYKRNGGGELSAGIQDGGQKTKRNSVVHLFCAQIVALNLTIALALRTVKRNRTILQIQLLDSKSG